MTHKLLIPAIRQYRHNMLQEDCEELRSEKAVMKKVLGRVRDDLLM